MCPTASFIIFVYMEKQRITVRFDDEIIKLINKQAKKEGRTKSNLIQLAMKKYLESVNQD